VSHYVIIITHHRAISLNCKLFLTTCMHAVERFICICWREKKL